MSNYREKDKNPMEFIIVGSVAFKPDGLIFQEGREEG